MNEPKMTPERLPDDIGAAPMGRYAAMRKIRDASKAKASTNPDDLLSAGVFIPPTDE